MDRTKFASDAEELAAYDALPERFDALKRQLGEVVVGQEAIIEHVLIATFCQGHVLLIGAPGLAKTLLIRALAASLDLSFNRIQFTPDLMPADILGSEILQTDPATGERSMQFVPGPVFANVILADELNRTPPKTQAALLEAMEEQQVTIAGATRPLGSPFLVMATQNPIEQEGAYPLPEAQLDRFLFTLNMDYPTHEEERAIAQAGAAFTKRVETLTPIFDGHELNGLRDLIGRTPVSEHVVDYAVRLVRSTRPGDPLCSETMKPMIEWGAGPRAGQALLLTARCLAALSGEPTPTVSHVRQLAPAVLRGRILLAYAALTQGVTADDLIEIALKQADRPM